MALLCECPVSHRKQGAKNRLCSCGENLDKAKRAGRVKYWITYRLPGGKQRERILTTDEYLNLVMKAPGHAYSDGCFFGFFSKSCFWPFKRSERTRSLPCCGPPEPYSGVFQGRLSNARAFPGINFRFRVKAL
jgi:hypothetical protein